MTLASVSPFPATTPSPEPSPLGVVVFVEVDEALAGRSGSTVVELAELLREFAQPRPRRAGCHPAGAVVRRRGAGAAGPAAAGRRWAADNAPVLAATAGTLAAAAA